MTRTKFVKQIGSFRDNRCVQPRKILSRNTFMKYEANVYAVFFVLQNESQIIKIFKLNLS